MDKVTFGMISTQLFFKALTRDNYCSTEHYIQKKSLKQYEISYYRNAHAIYSAYNEVVK